MSFKLCYVKNNWAFFTTLENLSQQWGDDWNDIPYEHNAGNPYIWYHTMEGRGTKPYKILTIAFHCYDLSEPCANYANSPWSVDMINKRETPWLHNYDWSKHIHGSGIKPPLNKEKSIWAGESIYEFCQKIKNLNGEVYMPIFNPLGE